MSVRCSTPCKSLNEDHGRLYSGRSSVVEYPSFPRGPMVFRMSQPSGSSVPSTPAPKEVSATRIFLRGLTISLPPILTLLILFWILHGINDFIVQPISWAVRSCIAQAVVPQQTRPIAELVKPDGLPPLPSFRERQNRQRQYLVSIEERKVLLHQLDQATLETRVRETEVVREQLKRVAYVQFDSLAVPYLDYVEVYERVGPEKMPTTATGIYMELAATRYFQSLFHLSAVAVVISIVMVYSIGRFVTHRLGAWFVMRVGSFVTGVPLVGAIYTAVKHVTDFFLAEKDPKYRRVVAVEYPRPGIWSLAFVTGVPLVGAIYTSVKHVTDFFLAEKDPKYRRVVAIEYPRPGIWTLAFVTGDGMSECVHVAGEPLVNVLIPSAPIPFAGYTMNVKRSELLELDMSLDQAIQYVMSCGVIVPTPTPPTKAANGVAEPPALPGQSTLPAF